MNKRLVSGMNLINKSANVAKSPLSNFIVYKLATKKLKISENNSIPEEIHMPEMCRGEVEIAVKKKLNNKRIKLTFTMICRGKGLIVRVHGIISSSSIYRGGSGQGPVWQVPHQPAQAQLLKKLYRNRTHTLLLSHNYPYSIATSSFLLMLLAVGVTS